jgi:hypothetical protein
MVQPQELKMKKLLLAATAALALCGTAHAETYIRLQGGQVTPKHECDATDKRPCIDCTFLENQTCYDQADKLGLIDHDSPNAKFFNQGQKPLEYECGRYEIDTQSISSLKGTIICPVRGATQLAEQPQPKVVVVAPYLPPEGLAGNSAVGIFFAQHCPGYITKAERQLIYTASQLNARESWSTVNDIETSLFSAAKANQTNPNQELFSWCIAAEPRIWDIKSKLGQKLLQ